MRSFLCLTSLKELTAIENQISDVNPLNNLIHLTKLDLSRNITSDIEPLIVAISLKELHLKGNPLSKKSLNDYIPKLRRRDVDIIY